jgi:hypothetical protein
MSAPACTHTWCNLDHAGQPQFEHTHETRLVATLSQAKARGARTAVHSQVSYVDGERGPLLFLSAVDVDLTQEQAEELIAQLRAHVRTMRAVQTSRSLAGAR